MDVIGYKKEDQIFDIQTTNEGEEIAFNNHISALHIIRHSAAHLMAQAIKNLYTNAKFYVGPVIEDGFYYDFSVDETLAEEDLKKIEKEMKNLAKQKIEITKYEVVKIDALHAYRNDELKQAVLENILDETVSFYKQKDFEDLCRGPHVPHTGYLQHVKLLKISGAYLGSNSKNQQLTRIYGTAFATKEALKEHLAFLEEAVKRDHRKINQELKLFTFKEEIGAGFAVWLPEGGKLRSKIEHWLFRLHRKKGYEPVRGPQMLKSDLWKVSGHYENYGKNMYVTNIDDAEFGLKPMNCVGHIKIYQNELHSYKDLPLKFFEYGLVHRHELSGALHGIFRTREFAQDDAHIFCTPEQIKPCIKEVLDFIHSVFAAFEFEFNLMISTRPKKAIGDIKIWDKSEQALKETLEEEGTMYDIDEGGGAFYGPKIDIKIKDSLKREWQCGTVQLDFNLPKRFDLGYIGQDNDRHQVVMIHRAILGSFERFIGILIEHCAGELPFFISPTPVILIPIRLEHNAFCHQIKEALIDINIDSKIFDGKDSLNKRIRNAEKQKVPMVIIIGDEEVKNQTVAIRDRRKKEQYNLTYKAFLTLCINQNKAQFEQTS